jgi:transcriptional regulator with XRE-family HTH domain
MVQTRSKPRTRRTLRTIDAVVASQISALRKRSGKSQQYLADKIGETQSTVARIESGRRSITIDELLRISAALDVAPVELLAASFQPEDVPITGSLRLAPARTRGWIRGDESLPGGDERAYYENTSDEVVFARRQRLREIEERPEIHAAALALAGRADEAPSDIRWLASQIQEATKQGRSFGWFGDIPQGDSTKEDS